MDKAFVLGAGLGTRLRPLTYVLPKPLIPVFHKPLIHYAFDHLLAAGVKEFIVNTHHLPQCYAAAFPQSEYHAAPITFRYEPVLLETGGGIANIADLVSGAPFLVYNGDILTDLPLEPLIAEHEASGNLVTLVLRSSGPARHIAYDAENKLVTDIRGKLSTGNMRSHQFTGIYAVAPAFLEYLLPVKVESVIPAFLKLIEQGKRIGAVVADDGQWWDLGDQENYLEAHRSLYELAGKFPKYADGEIDERVPVSVDALIHPSVRLSGLNVISAGAEIGEEAKLEDCIVWPDARVEKGAELVRSVVIPALPR